MITTNKLPYSAEKYKVKTITNHGYRVVVENYNKSIAVKKLEKIYHFHGFAWSNT